MPQRKKRLLSQIGKHGQKLLKLLLRQQRQVWTP